MLISPFPPSLAQRFEAGIAGLASGILAYQTAFHTETDPETPQETPTGIPPSISIAIDRFWQRFNDQITQVSQLDRPLANGLESSVLKSPDLGLSESLDWFWLSDLPWLWMLLQDPEGQREWLQQQPDPRLVLLLAIFEDLRHGRFSPDRSSFRAPHPGLDCPELDSSVLLEACPAAQCIWQTAVTLTERSATLAEGVAQWQTTQTLLPLSPDLQGIGMALWLAWRSDQVSLTLALAQQVSHSKISHSKISDRPLAEQSVWNEWELLPLAGLIGGFAHAPFPWWLISGLDRAGLQQQSDRLFGAWAGHYLAAQW